MDSYAISEELFAEVPVEFGPYLKPPNTEGEALDQLYLMRQDENNAERPTLVPAQGDEAKRPGWLPEGWGYDRRPQRNGNADKEQITQQGLFESFHRDMIVGFGSWEFDPMDLENSFPEGSVHLWQGDQDFLVPITLQHYIAEKLPWIQHTELKNEGHMFPYADGMGEAIIRELVLGEKPVF